MTDVDVVIVGFGPTGAVIANLLGEAGVRTAVFERDAGIYQLPRAVHFDAETMRTFQRLGLADEVAPISEPTFGMEFVNGAGERLFGTMAPGARGELGALGWVRGYMFYQPHLDAMLRTAVDRYPSVEVHLEHDVVAVQQPANEASNASDGSAGATVTVEDRRSGERRTVSARYLLACDGASSPVRGMLGTGLESLGFDQQWLVVDTMLKRDVDLPHSSQQICRSERPSTFVHSSGNHRRWEFQLQDGEDRDAISEPERVWELLSDWITPDDAELIRHVVYEFHGLVADRWRDGAVFLLGDAAHQMPPFQGQGMCSGIRDAFNLGWKLLGVLDGRWADAVLDSYEPERKPHAVAVVDSSVRVGKLIDWIAASSEAGIDLESPEARQERENATRRLAVPPLAGGVLQPAVPDGAPVGLQFPQPVLGPPEAPRHFDADLGAGFALVTAAGRDDLATPTIRAVLDRVGGRCVSGPATPELAGHALGALLQEHPAVLVRPDRYVHGVAAAPTEVDALVSVLAAQLGIED